MKKGKGRKGEKRKFKGNCTKKGLKKCCKKIKLLRFDSTIHEYRTILKLLPHAWSDYEDNSNTGLAALRTE